MSKKQSHNLDPYRDVIEMQDMSRNDLGKRKSVGWRILGSLIISLLCAGCFWALTGFIEFFTSQIGNPEFSLLHSSDLLLSYLQKFTPVKMMVSTAAFLITFIIFGIVTYRSKIMQDATVDTDDINQYTGDQHIAFVDEVQQKYDIFPDVGAHSSVSPSCMISHMALSNKGIRPVLKTKRAQEDIYDEDGKHLYYKGEPLVDDDGDFIYEKAPMFDINQMEALFETSGIPRRKRKWYSLAQPEQIRKYFDPKKIAYNPNRKNREKLPYDTWADVINNDWELPWYEPQQPSGVYMVDTRPVNTLILAITRAGKGQTVVEPTIDMWLREKNPNNIVVNDPKGELIVKNYVKATQRGFQVVQFNLINVLKTDVYNPLFMAADAAREGEFVKCAAYIDNIANVFFPVDGSEDPVWPNAAQNAFKRAAYGLIEYFLEEEHSLRREAKKKGISEKALNVKLDKMWGKVTLYNVYQFFVNMTSKTLKNPKSVFNARASAGEFEKLPPKEYDQLMKDVEVESELWEGQPELDLLTLYFNATKKLPQNKLRELISNADNALRSMAGAEKMLASVYGIAITAMSFFTDPTISTMTSGTPSQNVDLEGISFPRRIGVRFHSDFMRHYNLQGMQVEWSAYEDKRFKKPLDDPKKPAKEREFHHVDLVTREGWARYYFKGIFPKDTVYLKMKLFNPQTGMLIKTFYFEFKKSYQTSLDGRRFLKDPVLDEKIVRDGVLQELICTKKNGKKLFAPGNQQFATLGLDDVNSPNPKKITKKISAIRSTSVRYSEKPKIIFLVTPPHLMNYAKLILILLKQLVDLNFEKSYMTKPNQKPLYKTRFMLDELGNLQSDGHGISNFETMLSIGLGQDQQFTLILQTLQQLRSVYGENVDKIVQGNIANIIFLKSTDDTMIETLQKMSGTMHKVYRSSKVVQRNVSAVALKNKGDVSYTLQTQEEPVIKYNDLAYLSDRNSIVFSTESPIWNRNETILPMSWKLFENTIQNPGKEYTLQSIPTLSTASEFDRDANQPNFIKMYEKRVRQALASEDATRKYNTAFGYSDYDIARLDKDIYADDVMELIQQIIDSEPAPESIFDKRTMKNNDEMSQVLKEKQAEQAGQLKKRYAGGLLSRNDLLSNGMPNHAYDQIIAEAFTLAHGNFEQDRAHFVFDHRSMFSPQAEPYISVVNQDRESELFSEAALDAESAIYAEEDINLGDACQIHAAFYKFLVSQEDWLGFAGGRFEEEMYRILSRE